MNGSWKPCATHSPMNGRTKRYVAAIRSVGNLISTDHLKKGRLSQEGMDFFATSAAGMIASVTTNRDLQNVLAATSLLYGGIKNKSTFYEHAMINNSYLESAYRFTEGSMQVSLELIHIIRANGGTVLNRKEVTRILVKDEAIQGVEVNHGEILEVLTSYPTCIRNSPYPCWIKTIPSNRLLCRASSHWKTVTGYSRSI